MATAIFFGLSDVIPSWLTRDATIHVTLLELFPSIALVNAIMNMGIGAHGRYRLVASIVTACLLFVTTPIGAILTIWLRIDLMGLTFVVVIDYTVTSMLLIVGILMLD